MEFLTLRASDGASTRIASHGAHVCSWIPAQGQEQLFLSQRSAFTPDSAIRGGIPVIFPQFATLGPLPRHGFARTARWKLQSNEMHADGSAVAVFCLQENIARLRIWPHVFTASLTVRVHANTLQVSLAIENRGDTSFCFTAALHSYFALADLAQARLHGLQGVVYRDSLCDRNDVLETAEYLHNIQEIDRIYGPLSQPLRLEQAHQQLQIDSSGFTDAVVWNPGASGAVKLPDLEVGEEQRMLCVEAAVIHQPVVLAPGARWNGSQTMTLSYHL